MKHPFWLVNDILLLIFLTIIGFIIISQQKVPVPISLTPKAEVKPLKKAVSKIDLSKIYLNDLFETYQPPVTPPSSQEQIPQITMPEPPEPKPVKVPLALPPKFLDPLSIALKGIITLSDETDNIAIIQDTKNLSTKNYKVGDKIEDAQVIRIMSNKIILIRSNGQQETLYVNPTDAELDQQLHTRSNWSTVVQQKTEYSFLIDPFIFIQSIPNLAILIDKLNLITVYKKGQSVGCRVGMLQPKSLGLALGLKQGDLITFINSIPATTTDSRYEIYQKIIQMNVGDAIFVNLVRDQQELTLTYTLQQLEESSQPLISPLNKEKSAQMLEEERVELLRQQQQFAPTLQELKMQQKRNIVGYGNQGRRNYNILNRQA